MLISERKEVTARQGMEERHIERGGSKARGAGVAEGRKAEGIGEPNLSHPVLDRGSGRVKESRRSGIQVVVHAPGVHDLSER
jgi:hypothetical protein